MTAFEGVEPKFEKGWFLRGDLLHVRKKEGKDTWVGGGKGEDGGETPAEAELVAK